MTEDPDKKRGLYGKYFVQRLPEDFPKDGWARLIHMVKGIMGYVPGHVILSPPKHEKCEYFVLDLHHDKFSYAALKAYEQACRSEYPELAKDLADKLDEMWKRFRW